MNHFKHITLCIYQNISSMPDEVRLVNNLLDVYKKMGTVARPALNSSRLMQVQFGMRLIQMDIIEKEQVLQTSVWIRAVSVDFDTLCVHNDPMASQSGNRSIIDASGFKSIVHRCLFFISGPLMMRFGVFCTYPAEPKVDLPVVWGVMTFM